ncbi:hypothetical protein [Streptomyces malaysiense]|uniref:hypothetical protein n=1 Tax=Streptomyces malaysiense TaxID=1428626 RepID=UPI0009A0F271|nr:hypothetical protein [Streptomyces malaysiense]
MTEDVARPAGAGPRTGRPGGERCASPLATGPRLTAASVDKAKEMGIDWWESDPAPSSRARRDRPAREDTEPGGRPARPREPEPGRARKEAS